MASSAAPGSVRAGGVPKTLHGQWFLCRGKLIPGAAVHGAAGRPLPPVVNRRALLAGLAAAVLALAGCGGPPRPSFKATDITGADLHPAPGLPLAQVAWPTVKKAEWTVT